MVDAYVRIEAWRMGERLTFDVRIDENARACQLPALSLQPLVENAVGHGVARLPSGGTVVLRARRERDTLVLQVANPLAGDAPPVPGNRQALVNIRHRLALRYGDAAELRVTAEKARFTVDMIVPQRAESVS